MKLKYEFVVSEVADKAIAITVGEDAENFAGMIRLNETGAFIFEKLREETTEEAIVDEILEEYDIDRETAGKVVHDFVDYLDKKGVLA